MTTFADLGLSPELLAVIEAAGYVEPTPIQAEAIPVVLQGRDVVGIAQTGTGKTASFCFPMIDRLSRGRARARMPRSLILSPVRELATQTAVYFERYGVTAKLSHALLIGGVGLGEQERTLERGVDVLIATPGRLLDQFERGNILLGQVELLVIDEADRMLDMGFIPDVERIIQLLLKRRQTLLFSATMPAEIRRLADAFLDHPVQIEVARPATSAAGVEDAFVHVEADARSKEKALNQLISGRGIEKALVFCNRKRAVSALRRKLGRSGLNVVDIHGDLDQTERQRALEAFKRNEVDFLVATDVAARGLDIDQLPCVINFDAPTNPDDYVHRIGRTGRAGRAGLAFTLVTPEDEKLVGLISRHLGREIPFIELQDEPKRACRTTKTAETAETPLEAAAPAADPQSSADPAAAPKPRRRRRVAEPAPTEAPVEGVPLETTAPVEPELVAPSPSRRTRTRRPRTVEPATPAEVAAAAPEPVEAVAAEAPEAPAVREEEAARPLAATGRRAPQNPPRPRPGARRQGDGPIVGLGEHTPAFLLRPVPVRPVGPADDA